MHTMKTLKTIGMWAIFILAFVLWNWMNHAFGSGSGLWIAAPLGALIELIKDVLI
jgi:hypothetical protein